MELVAEMRSRGIGANVHTYSALMNGASPEYNIWQCSTIPECSCPTCRRSVRVEVVIKLARGLAACNSFVSFWHRLLSGSEPALTVRHPLVPRLDLVICCGGPLQYASSPVSWSWRWTSTARCARRA